MSDELNKNEMENLPEQAKEEKEEEMKETIFLTKQMFLKSK